MENNDKIKISREKQTHHIESDTMVYRTDLGKSSKIVSLSHQNTDTCIQKRDKYTYLDKRDNKIKYYELNKPVTIKDIKRKVRKYEELVLYNFNGGRNELFITLTCKDKVTDISVIKYRYNKFLARLRKNYENIDCIALFETTSNSYWHIHLFIKYVDTSKVLTIPQDKLLNYYWGYGAVHIIRNFNTFKNLGHSKDNRQKKLERLTEFPKGCRMYSKTKGIKTPPKQRLQFHECPEYNSNDYSITKSNTYTITNEKTGAIVNQITTIMYKNNNKI